MQQSFQVQQTEAGCPATRKKNILAINVDFTYSVTHDLWNEIPVQIWHIHILYFLYNCSPNSAYQAHTHTHKQKQNKKTVILPWHWKTTGKTVHEIHSTYTYLFTYIYFIYLFKDIYDTNNTMIMFKQVSDISCTTVQTMWCYHAYFTHHQYTV